MMESSHAESVTERRGDGFVHRRLDVGEVRLHVVEARPSDRDAAPLVVFLHGFPEFWGTWRDTLRVFARAGFWAVAPDLRGYNESDKPKGVAAYKIETLANDVAGLVRALGRQDAIVVGHDWGGAVAWTTAAEHPSLVRRLAILNVPHPAKMVKGLKAPSQLARSWYMFFFQLTGIAERALSKNDFAIVRRTFRKAGFSREDAESYVDAIRVEGALTGALNYYRSAIRRVLRGDVPKGGKVECPVLVVWGDRDPFLGSDLAEPPRALVPHARVVHLPNASHWVQHDAPKDVHDLLLGFAQEERGAGVAT